jgi:hypothetical protein
MMSNLPHASSIERDELIAMLAGAVGEKPVRDAVQTACKALKLPEDAWSVDDALRILDHLAALPGLLGITARFVKTRAILSWSQR